MISSVLENTRLFQRHTAEVLHAATTKNRFFGEPHQDRIAPSAVLLVLGKGCGGTDFSTEPCLILNKRSRLVLQPGDICCPGGGLSRLDPCLARLLSLPGLSMLGWPYWSEWRKQHPRQAALLALFLATGLREGFEEMRLNPFGVRFLGPLPPARLHLFRRIIFPMVVWVNRQKRFIPNREVEKVVRIPIRYLLNPGHYALYRVRFSKGIQQQVGRAEEDFPCFLFKRNGEREMLWGATYRIVVAFLQTVFGFIPPEADSLPVVSQTLRTAYLTGKERTPP